MAKKETLPAKWDEELAKYAQQAAELEKGSGGNFFGLKGGILAYDGAPIPGNKMCVIVLDGILENVYFSEAYDADHPAGPKCYAFGRDEQAMAPHQSVVERGDAQHQKCNGCQQNVFGTAEQGKGKACRNTRRVAMIPAGTYEKDTLMLFTKPEQFTSSPIAFMKLPVTSVKDYSAFVKQLAVVLKKPPFAVFAIVQVLPDPKTQFKVAFQAHQEAPSALIPTLLARHEEATKSIDFPYPQFTEEDEKLAEKKPKGKKTRKY